MKIVIICFLFAAFLIGLGAWMFMHDKEQAGGLLMLGGFIFASSVTYNSN